MTDPLTGGCACGRLRYELRERPRASCGSPVVTRLARLPDVVGVPAASLDDPSWFRPTMDLFTSSAQPWDHMNPELKKFERGIVRA